MPSTQCAQVKHFLIVKSLIIGADQTKRGKIGSWPRVIDLIESQTSSMRANKERNCLAFIDIAYLASILLYSFNLQNTIFCSNN